MFRTSFLLVSVVVVARFVRVWASSYGVMQFGHLQRAITLLAIEFCRDLALFTIKVLRFATAQNVIDINDLPKYQDLSNVMASVFAILYFFSCNSHVFIMTNHLPSVFNRACKRSS